MTADRVAPRAGGVRIVFDVPDDRVDHVADALGVAAPDFTVRRYYAVGGEPRRGGAPTGSTRLAAERARSTFTAEEQAAIVAAFEGVLASGRLPGAVIGVDVWAAGGGGGPAGVREPRRPHPRHDADADVDAGSAPTPAGRGGTDSR